MQEIKYSWMSIKFSAGDWDWQTHFYMECPHCDKTIEVEVESTPEFILRKF
jgi:phage terminase large subunit GpA-like protein